MKDFDKDDQNQTKDKTITLSRHAYDSLCFGSNHPTVCLVSSVCVRCLFSFL